MAAWWRSRNQRALTLGLGIVGWAGSLAVSHAAAAPHRLGDPPPSTAGQEHQEETLPLPLLRWGFQVGQVYQLEVSQASSTEINVAGNKTLQPASRRAKIRWEVTSANDEEMVVELRYTEVEMELGTSAGQVLASTNPATPQIGSGKAGQLLRGLEGSLQPLLDQPITVRLDPRGQVREVTLSEPLQKHLQREVATRPLRQAVSPSGIQDLVSGFLAPLPAQARPQWEHRHTVELSAGVPMTHTTRYQIGPWQAGQETVEVKFMTDLAFPEQYLLGAGQPDDPNASPAVDPNPPRDARPPFDFDPISRKWPRIAVQDSGGTFTFDVQAGYVRQANAKTVIVTEKAYSDAKIVVTITTQTEVKARRL